MDPALWLLPFIGAFIGWATNVIAIRMLFRPHRPVRVPMTPLILQGVLPRRHADLSGQHRPRRWPKSCSRRRSCWSGWMWRAIKGEMVAAVRST